MDRTVEETESWYKQGYTDAYYGKDYSDRVPRERIESYKEGQYRFWEEYYLNLAGEYSNKYTGMSY